MENNKQISINESYFLCSEMVVKLIKPTIVSKPFFDNKFNNIGIYYIAVLGFDECKNIFNNLTDEEQYNYFIQECTPITIYDRGLSLTKIKSNRIFNEIESKLGLTLLENIASTIYNLSEKYDCSPIDVINRISRHSIKLNN